MYYDKDLPQQIEINSQHRKPNKEVYWVKSVKQAAA